MNQLTPENLQWLGCALGIAGSFLLALNLKCSGWGFVIYLVSNAFWIAFGVSTHAPGITTNQVFNTLTSLLGIYKWLVIKNHLRS
jgi:hypothetical protein